MQRLRMMAKDGPIGHKKCAEMNSSYSIERKCAGAAILQVTAPRFRDLKLVSLDRRKRIKRDRLLVVSLEEKINLVSSISKKTQGNVAADYDANATTTAGPQLAVRSGRSLQPLISSNLHRQQEDRQKGSSSRLLRSRAVTAANQLFLVRMPSLASRPGAPELLLGLWLTSALLSCAGWALDQPDRTELVTNGYGANHKSVLAMNSDPLIQMPPFVPTRRPQAQQTLTGHDVAHKTPKSVHSTTILQGSASVISGSNLPFHQIQPAGSSNSASPKFAPFNELDTFLDEMDHNELRAVAANRPIAGLFESKPLSQGYDVAAGRKPNASLEAAAPGQQDRRSTGAQPAPIGHMGEGDGQQLMGSHSEQQIYSECALILQRTYVKNIDDPKHQLVPFGKSEQACISYKHIDKAVEQAKHKLKFREFARLRKKPVYSSDALKPPVAPLDVIHSSLEPPEDLVAAIGEINMAATQIIADQFDLSNDELLNGLPLIDMSKTKFWDICPLFVRSDLRCELTRFRTFTGHCNNLKHPTWGAARTPYARYLPPVHPDGIWVPRKSIVSELTFDLGVGHREMHANIVPSQALPPISGEHHGRVHFPVHEHPDDMSASDAAPPGGHHRRLGGGVSVEQLTRQADEELRRPARSTEDLAPATSNHFFRRTPLAAALHGEMGLDLALEGAGLAIPLEPPTYQFQHQEFSHNQRVAAAAAGMHVRHQPPPHLAQAPTTLRHRMLKSRSVPQELPPARLVSSLVHRDVDVPNHEFTVLFMSWGQLLDHDMTRAAQPPSTIKCCPQANGEQPAKHKLCLPIQVPPDDPFYSKFNVQCLEFRRTLAGVRPNCVLGPRVHQNANTSPIDANFVYGSSQEMADSLRLFRGGRLRDRDWFHREGLKPLLPAQEVDPDLACLGRPKDLFCFLAGDIRVNEQTHLTVLHTLYMREHNRIADKLSELNPHWDDERTFQEARHIVAAGVQHVLINEYIPLLIGRKMSQLYNLTAQAAHQEAQFAFWHGYDPSVTTSVSNSFAAAAFRQGHTFVQSTIDRFNKFHEFVASEKLRHLFMQPFLIYQPGVMDELVGGLINKQSQSHDPFISEELSGHLFQAPEAEFGHDLAAINLQRGREQGLPGYNLFREWCGLPRAETFEQLEPYLTNHTAYMYSRIYKHVDDIDLWSGGISERKLPGAAIGPTFACIIARQFSNTRRGDRFWYENPGLPSSFTPDQLAELRKFTLAKLLCTNADDLPTIQRWAFRLPHPVLNPRVDCHQLPEVDLQFWQEE